MKRRLSTAAILALGAASAFGADGPQRLPSENLMVFRDESGEPKVVRTIEDWKKRRAEIVRGVETIMGRFPGDEKRVPLDVVVEEEVDCGSYVRKSISYASEPGGRTPAYLLVPKREQASTAVERMPAALCLHGTNNTIGAGSIVGIADVPNRQYARELAERGYVVLAPHYPRLASYQPDLDALGWESGSLKAVWDGVRGVDLLTSLPYVDPHAVVAIGHSLGGHNAVFTAVFDDRIKAVVSSCGLDSFVDYMHGDEANWSPERGWCQTRYMRKLADYKGRLDAIPFDFAELLGALAPRKVLVIAPYGDTNFQWKSVDRITAAARPVFDLYDADASLRVDHPDCEHDFPQAARTAAYEWLDAALRTTP